MSAIEMNMKSTETPGMTVCAQTPDLTRSYFIRINLHESTSSIGFELHYVCVFGVG